ncbi:YozE family protein [Enterococcus lemanii]|jgi:uncharacterized protein YozE (UPF0346 family)|uniref:UPF0346 protein ACFO5I_08160 n=1 Tax=Enterococcus lemanii TaxID=1159752 RepID=A0ABV9MUN7_9ENTE|nr:YozE family protein [Enterococcus lemanii]MBM7709967.1 uncharacterized protein YozE (UPF0346 family) [Enterococcus lemanii]
MRKTFYQYLMTFKDARQPNAVSLLAQHVHQDLQFPKQSNDYHQISDYLELNTSYLASLAIFDEIWEKFLEENET